MVIVSPAGASLRSAVRAATITLDAADYPAHKIFQRDSAGQYAFALRGTVTGGCDGVEASFAGRPFVSIDTAPGSLFEGTLVASAGQGSIVVRCENDPNASAAVGNIGVGDVYVVAGQSNAEGQGLNPQSYATTAGSSALKPTVFTEADQWKLGDDHTDIQGGAGSAWPIVGGYVVANANVPVAFITTATGGSKLVAPNEWQPGGAACVAINRNCYDNMVDQVADAGVNGVKAVLWFQGEGDARFGQTRVAYNNALDELAANVRNDLPGAPSLVAGVIGPWTIGSGTDNVRFATMDAWTDNATVLAGPQTYDIHITDDEYFDDKHFAADDELQTLGYRWWKALDDHFYGGSDGRGPLAVSAVVNAAGTAIDVTFADASGLSLDRPDLTSAAWRVTDGGVNVALSSATVVSSTDVRLVPTTPMSANGAVTVSFASQNDGEGATVPVDTATGNVGLGPSGLPADPFLGLVAARTSAPTQGSASAQGSSPSQGSEAAGSSHECGAVALGSFGRGIAATDEASGAGYLMFSEESVFSRFAGAAPLVGSAEHVVAVVFDEASGVWQYDRNFALVEFVPRPSDVLVASVDFGTDAVVMLDGQGSLSVGGVQLGYESSDLLVTANRWGGWPNDGEFGLSGSWLESGSCAQPSECEAAGVGSLGLGIAALDGASGRGYVMFSEESVFSRFADVPPLVGAAEHLVAVVFDAGSGGWRYDHNTGLRAFTPRSSDVLVASVDFGTDDVVMLDGRDAQTVGGVQLGYESSDLEVTANRWNGRPNAGEFGVSGSWLAPSSCDANVEPLSCDAVAVGFLGFGIAARDGASGTGYVMFSEESLFSRFGGATPFVGAAEHLVAVVFDEASGTWRYDRNSHLRTFEPRPSDVLVASVDFGRDGVVMLNGQGALSVGGVKLGYASSDLVITANEWNGWPNAGEFGLAGTHFCR